MIYKFHCRIRDTVCCCAVFTSEGEEVLLHLEWDNSANIGSLFLYGTTWALSPSDYISWLFSVDEGWGDGATYGT